MHKGKNMIWWRNKSTYIKTRNSIGTDKQPLVVKHNNTLVNWPLQKSSGLCRGSITNSFNVSFTFSSAPISSKVTPISLGGMTSARSLFSKSFSVTTSYSCIKNMSTNFGMQRFQQFINMYYTYLQWLGITKITLRDFFKLLDSFWVEWRISIPYCILREDKKKIKLMVTYPICFFYYVPTQLFICPVLTVVLLFVHPSHLKMTLSPIWVS